MGTLYVIYRTGDMNFIDSAWSFKLKFFPDILINKFKDIIFSRGDQQL